MEWLRKKVRELERFRGLSAQPERRSSAFQLTLTAEYNWKASITNTHTTFFIQKRFTARV